MTPSDSSLALIGRVGRVPVVLLAVRICPPLLRMTAGDDVDDVYSDIGYRAVASVEAVEAVEAER